MRRGAKLEPPPRLEALAVLFPPQPVLPELIQGLFVLQNLWRLLLLCPALTPSLFPSPCQAREPGPHHGPRPAI